MVMIFRCSILLLILSVAPFGFAVDAPPSTSTQTTTTNITQTSTSSSIQTKESALTPTLPKGVEALPADMTAQMKQLMEAVEKYRGLTFKQPVLCGKVNKEVLRQKILDEFKDELPQDKMDQWETSLKAFGLIPETMNLGKFLPDLLTSQIAGFYDPKEKYLTLISDDTGSLDVKGIEKVLGAKMAERMKWTLMVHELTHGIQDQYFDLQKIGDRNEFSDSGTARIALVEGDATLTMYDYFLEKQLEQLPGFSEIMSKMFDDPKQLTSMVPDMPGSKELEAAPEWFKDNLLFSYLQGFTFCADVKQHGGQKLLDFAFSKDLPMSSEQILHPDKWYNHRDNPITIQWPDLSKELSGYQKISNGDVGEQGIKVFLRSQLKASNAAEAAAGWGGDSFVVYKNGENRLLLWITDWDSNQDASEFQHALANLGKDWMVDSPRPGRVTVIRGTIDAALRDSLRSKLGEAKATVSDNKPIDLAALGIDLKKAANQDLGKMMKDLVKEQPKGSLSADGRTYSNQELGIEWKLLDSQKDWKFSESPPPPMLASVRDQAGGLIMNLICQSLPMEMPLESVTGGFEMGLSRTLPGYKKLSGQYLNDKDGRKFYELQCEGDKAGNSMHLINRVYIMGPKLLAVSAVVYYGQWDEMESTVLDSLDLIKLTSSAPTAPKSADPKAPEVPKTSSTPPLSESKPTANPALPQKTEQKTSP
jgi:hypothetical protein